MAWFSAGAMLLAEDTPRLLRFDPSVIEIDTVWYDSGVLALRFECVNIADKDVSILQVRTLCGCAKVVGHSDIIRPGKKGYVDVEFDPHSLFAEQKKYLTVVATNGDYKKFNTLTIHGYVDRGVTEEEVRYPHELAPGLRSEVNSVGMRLSGKGETSVKKFTVYNATSLPMSLGWKTNNKRARAVVPPSLESGTSARIEVSVSVRGKPSGPYADTLYLIVNGEPSVPIPLKGAVK